MKKALPFFAICFSLTVNAQVVPYVPFPDSNAVWREYYVYYDGICTLYEHSYRLEIKGDTSFNGYTYHKIYRTDSTLVWSVFPPCNSFPSWTYYADALVYAIREDTTKKIWLNTAFQGPDTLLYDFNMTIGDTLKNQFNSQVNIVAGIDSVLMGGQFRRRYLLNHYPSPPPVNQSYIIEGIGSTYGLTNFIEPFFESGGRLLCFFQNGQLLYSDSMVTACSYALGLNEANAAVFSHAKIYPNPFHSSALIELPQSNQVPAYFFMYDQYGRIVESCVIHSQRKLLSRNNMPSGMYYYQIIDNNGNLHTGKLIIE